MSWFLYVLECRDGSLYTGITNNVAARYAAHAAGTGARYTRAHPPARLLLTLPYADRSASSKAEYALKQLSAPRKRAYIRDCLAVQAIETRAPALTGTAGAPARIAPRAGREPPVLAALPAEPAVRTGRRDSTIPAHPSQTRQAVAGQGAEKRRATPPAITRRTAVQGAAKQPVAKGAAAKPATTKQVAGKRAAGKRATAKRAAVKPATAKPVADKQTAAKTQVPAKRAPLKQMTAKQAAAKQLAAKRARAKAPATQVAGKQAAARGATGQRATGRHAAPEPPAAKPAAVRPANAVSRKTRAAADAPLPKT